MGRTKKVLSIVVMLCILLGFSIVVYAAAPYLDYGSSTGRITVQEYSDKYNDTWVTIINESMSAWNNSGADVNISITNASVNTIEAARYNDSWYGLTIQTLSTSGYTSQFCIKLNARTIGDDATNAVNFAKSTATHEFGHVFWLCDNPSTTEPSIMKYSRDRNVMVTPQPVDVENVNKKY